MTDNRLKLLFGFLLLVCLAALTAAIALGHVEENTSYGLIPIITCLATLAGSFSNWAFGSTNNPEKKEPPPPPKE